ncbi:alpha-N-acetyl-neuraminyl-2,3-beta-galactosyl-1,3-N-acetyl-galactosaminide alpha-2,6-sialyltransferase-like [Diadema antillarum]|uniref:alpha-N-acetyl-neuraminyl-2,3-beta-galactosyl-1, 3-N-acetyl-galactosaminide alpha-2,6-sialyltransferase-like n=1 Tax=Diadema antillarum TaxID=105358 RepID=UPI003A89BE00
MHWRRPIRYLAATVAYSVVISLVYVAFIHRQDRLTAPTSTVAQRINRKRFLSKWTPRSVVPVAGQNFSDHWQEFRPVQHKQHEGYMNILSGQPLRLSCSSCAVVSSSGHLLKTDAGHEIDSAECVFRMNSAPVRGFERDVGSKTTVRSIAHVNLARAFEKTDNARKELLQDNDTRSEYLLINWMNRVNVRRLQDREYRYAVLLAHLYPKVNFYGFSSDQMHYAERVFRKETGVSRQQANTWLSTGWFTMLAAIDICDDIIVYGMAYDDYCSDISNETRSVPYHYYEPHGMKECAYYNVSETRLDGGHLFITEKAIFKRWTLNHSISFKYPSWPVDHEVDQPLDSPFLRRYRELMNQTNYAVHSVRDYLQLEREAKRRALAEERTIELKHGNRTFVIERRQLIQKVLELVPEAEPIAKGGAIGQVSDKQYARNREERRIRRALRAREAPKEQDYAKDRENIARLVSLKDPKTL